MLIQVKAAAVNPVELLILTGSVKLIQDYPMPLTAVLKKGGRLVSLRTGPNKAFAQRKQFSGLKKLLFSLAGSKYDKAAKKQGKEYRFVFVRSDGAQLRKITEIVEQQQVKPAVDPHIFSLDQVKDALQLVAKRPLNGKVIIQL